MADPRTEILKMLRDGKINVEEAERLLAALDAGAERRSRPPGGFFGWWKKLDDLGVDEDLRDIGELIRREVEQAVRVPFGDHADDAGDEVPVTDGRFEIPGDTGLSLFVTQRPDLELVAVDGAVCRVDGDLARIRETGGRFLVDLGRSRGHDEPTARIEVPRSVKDLRVATAGSRIEATGLSCPSVLKSMGGNIRLTDPGAPFQVRTLGGNLDVRLGTPVSGTCRVESLGGRVEVALAEDQAGRVHASSGGGPLRVDPELGVAEGPDLTGGWRGTLELTGTVGDLDLTVRSVGGPVRLRRSRG